MAVNFTTAANIYRTNTFANLKTADWTKSFWLRLGTTTPGGGQFRYYWQYSTTGNYIYVGSQAATNDLYLEIGTGGFPSIAATALNQRQWYFIVIQYTDSTNTIELFIDNVSVGTLVFDINTLTFGNTDEVHCRPGDFQDFSVAMERFWQRKLSAAELAAEKLAFKVALTTNLLTDSPLASNSYLNDYSGNARNWSFNGTIGYKAGPLVNNNSLANAFDIGTTLPFVYPQDTNLMDVGADTYQTIPVYYKFTANFNGVLGVFGFGDTVTFRPESEIYSPNISTIYFDLQSGSTNRNKPLWFPVVNGQTYWFSHFLLGGTDVTPAVLLLSTVQGEDNLIQPGDFLTNFEVDNNYEFPLCVLKNDVDYEVRKFVQMTSPLGGVRGNSGLPHGEYGQILSNGNFILSDEQFLNLKIYDSNCNLVTTINNYLTSGSILPLGISKVLQKFYVAHTVGGNPFKIDQLSNNGVIENSWILTSITSLKCLAVNSDASILYYSQGGASAIKRWDLINDISLSDLVADTPDYEIHDLIFLEDDTLLALFHEETGTPRDVYVKRYNTSGTVLNTYNFGIFWRSEFNPPRMGFALDSPTHFWIVLKPEASFQISSFRKIRVSDGSTITTRNHVNYLFGFYIGNETASPEGRFGPEKSFPVLLAQIASTVRNSNSGLYYLTGGSVLNPTIRHDALIDANEVEQNVAIPEPFFETSLIPDED